MLKKIQGRVSSYLSVPIRCEEGYKTTAFLADDEENDDHDEISLFRLEIFSQRPDDSVVWITNCGCGLIARNVLVDSEFDRKGSVHWSDVQVIINDEFVPIDYQSNWWWYGDISTPLKICGFIRHVLDCVLVVSFEQQNDIHCVDKGKAKEILKIGVGCQVILFNVKMKMAERHAEEGQQYSITITEQSGIRVVVDEEDDRVERDVVKQPVYDKHRSNVKSKWECIHCGCMNFFSKSTCKACQKLKCEGPMKLDVDRKRWESEKKWFCSKCGYEKNFQANETCWKCNAKRNHKRK